MVKDDEKTLWYWAELAVFHNEDHDKDVIVPIGAWGYVKADLLKMCVERQPVYGPRIPSLQICKDIRDGKKIIVDAEQFQEALGVLEFYSKFDQCKADNHILATLKDDKYGQNARDFLARVKK